MPVSQALDQDSIAILHDISGPARRTDVAPRWVLQTNSSRPGTVLALFGIIDAGRHSMYGADVHTGSMEGIRYWEELECDFQGRQVPGHEALHNRLYGTPANTFSARSARTRRWW